MAATAGGKLLNLALKQVFHPTRLVEHGVLVFSGFSSPSGHVAAATLLYSFVAAFAVMHPRDTWWRITAVASPGAMVLAVAFSRPYLAAHFLSDTLAKFAAAMAWPILCIVVFHGRLSYRPGSHSAARARPNESRQP